MIFSSKRSWGFIVCVCLGWILKKEALNLDRFFSLLDRLGRS